MAALKVGFIGGGQMGEAIIRGFLKANIVSSPDHIFVADPWKAQMEKLNNQLKINTGDDNNVVAKNANVIFLAVKPNIVETALKNLLPVLTAEHLIISIAAGVPLSSLEKYLTEADTPKCRVVRVMPNTPCLVGQAASAFSPGTTATEEDRNLVKKLLEAVGVAFEVPENLLDAVTGMSGSGPAFVYMFIEAMSDGGVRNGLPRQMATQMAAQTVAGAAQMVLNGKHPGELKDAVTSPGGTTIEGVAQLENGGMRAAVINAVTGATKRSVELRELSEKAAK
eukprot:TRINITY_DN113368_c0_g1_i1.p1 TRINITY_DN113368_c0_g1~~TRINITY_DN113368_c0_g1_i1.p1  ORF type:complete len:281 (-),score=50.63 TRINITY_DN113368_c0_g1_i1:118-960(-)